MMFYLRAATQNDLEDLYELSKLVHFINLPPDKEILKHQILLSEKSFNEQIGDFASQYFTFVLIDASTDKVIGASMIHSQHGTEESPHFFLKVDIEQKYSQSMNTGFTHGTLKLGTNTDGPTEIGGLVLHPNYRGHKDKLGKQLSFVRFQYMAIHPEHFKDEIHSELMPPMDKDGNPPLWEAIGRRFMNMNYFEADKLSRNNKEFILSLYPSDNIYVTLLPIEAREAIGKVGNDTLPVKKMLESIGFEYTNEVDPFDGGPHYRAKQQDILPIKKTSKLLYKSPMKLDNYQKRETLKGLIAQEVEGLTSQYFTVDIIDNKYITFDTDDSILKPGENDEIWFTSI